MFCRHDKASIDFTSEEQKTLQGIMTGAISPCPKLAELNLGRTLSAEHLAAVKTNASKLCFGKIEGI